MKKVKYIILLGLLTVFVCSFQTGENKIYWSTEPLTWSDFKGKPDIGNENNAVTDYNISVIPKLKKDSISFEVKCFFSTMSSWVKEGTDTDLLLKHEQGHFDLAEIYARLLRKELLENKFFYRTIQEDFTKLQTASMDNCNKEQVLYDRETNHSSNKERQLEWNRKFEKQLKELEAYRKSIVTVAFKR